MTCDEWQIRIERRDHGEQSPEEALALEAHVESCETCRTYAGVALGTEATMRAAGAELGTHIDWQRVHAGVERGARRARLELGLGVVWALVSLGVVVHHVPLLDVLLASGVAMAVLIASLIPSVALAVVAYRYTLGRARSARMVRQSDGASLNWMREELDARIRARRSALFWEVAFCGLIAAVALFEDLGGHDGVRVAFGMFVAASVTDAAIAAFRTLPRLARERDELG